MSARMATKSSHAAPENSLAEKEMAISLIPPESLSIRGVGSWLKLQEDFTHFIQKVPTAYPWRSCMATDSELQWIVFMGDGCAKPRRKFELICFGISQSQRFLRRANEPQKCFVSGETESVANTSAFVSPVAFNSAEATPL